MRLAMLLLPLLAATAAPLAAAEVVPVGQFRSVELRGGGTVVVRPGPTQRVTLVQGSTQATQFRVDRGGKLRIDACAGRCPRHYNLTIEISSPHMIDAAITGGGSVTAAPGFAPQRQVSVAVNGGGRIDVRSVRAASVSAAVNGGGKVLTGHSDKLSAAVSGGGEVRYASSGNVSSATHGGGSVRQGN